MNFSKSLFIYSVTALLFVIGCATSQRATKAQMDMMHAEPRIRPGFSLDVVVLVTGTKEVEELSRRVAANGSIRLPLVGDVAAGALTLKELTSVLETNYSRYFVNPKVAVEFSKDLGPDAISPWGSVTVMGRVVKPGKVNIPPTRDLTVSRAIQQVGGFSSSANQSSIRITRPLQNGTTDAIRVDLKAMATGNLAEDILLYPGDVIFVPERLL